MVKEKTWDKESYAFAQEVFNLAKKQVAGKTNEPTALQHLAASVKQLTTRHTNKALGRIKRRINDGIVAYRKTVLKKIPDQSTKTVVEKISYPVL